MSSLTNADLEDISIRLRKYKDKINRVKLNVSKDDILRICRDKPTHDNIDIITSASVFINGIRFDLIKT